jgi:hypothetical protein
LGPGSSNIHSVCAPPIFLVLFFRRFFIRDTACLHPLFVSIWSLKKHCAMRFFARLRIAASMGTAALAAPYAISVGEISVRRGVAAGFLCWNPSGRGSVHFSPLQVIFLISNESRFRSAPGTWYDPGPSTASLHWSQHIL